MLSVLVSVAHISVFGVGETVEREDWSCSLLVSVAHISVFGVGETVEIEDCSCSLCLYLWHIFLCLVWVKQ